MVDALSDVTETQRIESARRPFAGWPVCLIGIGVTLLLLITANRYDYHRDELYFRLLGQHPQWGYIDQPPFTPLLVRFGTEMFGDTLWAARVPAALLLGLTAVLAAAIAREAGGGTVAQSIAASGVLGVFPLSSAHVSSTGTTDMLIWLGVLFLVMRALLWERPRAWLGAGVVAGLGLYNKHLVVLLLLCLAAGLALAGPRAVFRSPHLWVGVILAVAVGSPNLIYQVVNGFPQAEMAAAIAENKGAESRAMLLPLQLAFLTLPPVWIAGIVTLVRDPRLRRVRAIAVAYPLMLVLVLVTAGQPYYPVGLLFGLFAIGAVPVERWLTGRRGRRALVAAGAVVMSLAGIVMSLPVIGERAVAGTPPAEANQTIADQIGWREYVWQIGTVYAGLSATDQSRTVLFTGNYGEAGALDRYGPPLRLPKAYSGHNELHRFGPPPDSKKVVVAVLQTSPERASELIGACVARATLRNSAGVENEEVGTRVYVCRPAEPWSVIWPRLQHYD
ncbi:glycosyltransferase family 39 protein [Actinoplanes sp. NEAU-A12]|uniref:Glycosyltransferase family 39 protein n=1 Tax=Actinoplanes sandaracinus TaxID=3045177 RepID=A0ABT6WNS8_9ACTN|nr:glycosyltransferase family 39 protein [Actinoplanes sandaracinus]MDI6101354.1 glycosyltransferase family 39 protein [Actinoplanes sandaracinus]